MNWFVMIVMAFWGLSCAAALWGGSRIVKGSIDKKGHLHKAHVRFDGQKPLKNHSP